MPKDITNAAHDRDSDGEVLPITKTVEVRDEEYELEVYPATTGQRNEWKNKLLDVGEELPDDLEAELLDEFLDYEPDDFGAESWADVRPAITDAAGEAILAEVFDQPQDEFFDALEGAVAETTSGNADSAGPN